MGLRKNPKPDPRRSDNKASNNQSSGSACGRYGDSSEITVRATNGSGNTTEMKQDCPSCN